MRLRDVAAYQSVVSPYEQIKHEEDNRMHDVIPSRPPFTNTYPHSPRSGFMGVYKDPGSPTELYWSTHEGGRSKYKKRSRAAPPGRCHSCNIEQTPEWRRGPDGARTLCNACGLRISFTWLTNADYAKVTKRKEREQAQTADGTNVQQHQQQHMPSQPPSQPQSQENMP
jgi:hypothetical protein